VFADTKERFSKKTGIKGKALERIKFAAVVKGYNKPDYLTDGKLMPIIDVTPVLTTVLAEDILWDKCPAQDGMLGCDHTNKARSIWNRADSIFIR
jgi:ubiquitin carboxyl-terminal hydrolase 7